MNPRYFVKYKNLRDPQTDVQEVCIGRFCDEEAAEHRGKEAYNVDGYGKLISIRPETPWEAQVYRISRFLIRAFRIAIAVVIALTAYVWLSDTNSNIGDVPFAELTAKMVFGSLFHMSLIIGSALFCWFIAFGEGPDN
jgi:hypothetical protein